MGAGLGRGRRAARRSIEGLCITRAGLCFSSWIFSYPNPNPVAIPTLALNLTIGNHCGVTLGKTLITLTLGCLTLGHIALQMTARILLTLMLILRGAIVWLCWFSEGTGGRAHNQM